MYSRNLKLLVPFFDRPSIGLQKIDKVVILYVKFHFSSSNRIVGHLHQNVLTDWEGKVMKCFDGKTPVFKLGLAKILYVFCDSKVSRIVSLSCIWENGWCKALHLFYFFLFGFSLDCGERCLRWQVTVYRFIVNSILFRKRWVQFQQMLLSYCTFRRQQEENSVLSCYLIWFWLQA